jgi:hypothetical protein
VQRLLDIFDELRIPVFFKGNLKWDEWREEFPQITKRTLLENAFNF